MVKRFRVRRQGSVLGEYTREELAIALLEGAIDNRDEVELSVGDWCTVKQFADLVDQKPGTATQPAQISTHQATSPNRAMSSQTLIPILASIAVSAIAVTVALFMFWPKGERENKSPTPEQDTQAKQEPVRPRVVENKEPETIPELTAPELSARKSAVVPIGVQIAGDFLICGSATITEGNRAVTSGLVADYIINTIQLAKKERPKDPIGAAIRFNGANLGIDKFKFHSKRRPDQIEYNVAWAKVIDQVSANWNQQLPTKPLAKNRPLLCLAWDGKNLDVLSYAPVERELTVKAAMTGASGAIVAYELEGELPSVSSGGMIMNGSVWAGIAFKHPSGWKCLSTESFIAELRQ